MRHFWQSDLSPSTRRDATRPGACPRMAWWAKACGYFYEADWSVTDLVDARLLDDTIGVSGHQAISTGHSERVDDDCIQTASSYVSTPILAGDFKMVSITHTLALAALAAAAPSIASLKVDAIAPDFTTQATLAGRPFSFHLADALRRGPVVLYFFPAAFTNGCTVEAHEFAEATAAFASLGATVVGVSADPIEKLNRFSVSECRNKFAVASADRRLISAYKVTLPLLGRSNRTSYVIAPDSHVLLAYSALNPKGHVDKALSAVKEWRARHWNSSAP